MELSVIIPTKDRGKIFDETLAATVAATNHLDVEIIVVNDSKSGCPIIPANFGCVKLIQNEKQGVASARNLGASHSKGLILLFLDDDILISTESINQVLKVHGQVDHAALNLNWVYPLQTLKSLVDHAFGRFLIAHEMTTFKGWYANSTWEDHSLFQSNSVASFHLSMSRGDFEKTTGYSETFPYAGFEDYDFPPRLKDAGLSFYIDTRVTIFHNESDRGILSTWLESQERRAFTRRVAVGLGHGELKLSYAGHKKVLLELLLFFSPVLMLVLNNWLKDNILDRLYFRLAAALQAARIYKGYTRGEAT